MAAENLYSTLIFESLQILQLVVSRLLKTRLIQCLSLDETYTHPRGPPGRLKRLSYVGLPLCKACSSALSHSEEKYPVPGLHVDIAKEKQTAQLNGLSTGEKLGRIKEERNYYAADRAFPFLRRAMTDALDLWKGAA